MDTEPRGPPLSPPVTGAVHVWLVPLADVPINGAAAVLTPDEREQASRFVSASLTRRFICKRAALHQILASYARTRVIDFAFGTGAQGTSLAPSSLPRRTPLPFSERAGGGR